MIIRNQDAKHSLWRPRRFAAWALYQCAQVLLMLLAEDGEKAVKLTITFMRRTPFACGAITRG